MSQYIDGFVVSVPKNKLAAYKKMATKASKVWMGHGALEYRECVGDDMTAPGMVTFPKLAKSKPDEVVIFAYVVFKSRQHRDATNMAMTPCIWVIGCGSPASPTSCHPWTKPSGWG